MTALVVAAPSRPSGWLPTVCVGLPTPTYYGRLMSARSIDRQQAAAAVRRTLARAPNQLADGVGRVVRNTPDERLAQVMRSPARRLILDGIFSQMPQYIDRARAREVSSSVRWCITGRADGGTDIYQLQIEEGHCRVIGGSRAPDPQLTITVDAAEFLKLATGGSDPMHAYFTGRVTLIGDVMTAAKLVSLFRIPVPSNGKQEARLSGKLEWRLQRAPPGRRRVPPGGIEPPLPA